MAILRREGLKWLATKTVLKDRRYAYLITDETAIAEDLESGLVSSSNAPKTYLIALSRKVTTDIDMITQMLSMVDKRAQWLADVPMLCLAHNFPESNKVDYFEYQIWDQGLNRVINSWDVDGDFASRWLFPRFETGDVPLSDDKLRLFEAFFNITEADKKQFQYDMAGKRVKVIPKASEPIEHRSRWMRKKGTRILIDKKHYEVMIQPEFDSLRLEWIHQVVPRFEEFEIEEIDEEEQLRKAKAEYLKVQTSDGINEVIADLVKNVDVTSEDIKDYKAETGYQG